MVRTMNSEYTMMNLEYEMIEECIACGSEDLVPVLDLGKQPLANSYKKSAYDTESYFPLAINRCKECFHVQLSVRVDPDLMYKDYAYVSGTAKTQLDYFDWFAEFAAEKYGTKPINVLDIGCNDGSQLNSFQDRGAQTYGVDPAENLFATSSQRHKVVCGYFTGKEFSHEKFDIITCQNAFAHNFNQLELLQNIRNVMHKDSLLFATTSQCDMILNGEFDTIYHEHLSFYNVKSIDALCKRAGLNLVDVIKSPVHGMSYIFVISKFAKAPRTIENLILHETNKGLYSPETYDTKNNPRAAVKHIYDIALTLKRNGYNSKILVEDSSYTGVKGWLGDTYDELSVVSIKTDKIEINVDDIMVVPEFYSNVLQQLANIRCTKIMLIQQKEYIFETLPMGSRWSDYGFYRAIVTTEKLKKYVQEIFPEMLTFIIPPIIGDNFSPSEKPVKPFVSIHCRNRSVQKKIISEFYLKFPQLRWITFRDMVQMTYEDFSNGLKESMVSLWLDDESTFGTFPLESMKCGVPVVGKIPDTEPDWLSENGMWTYDESKLVEILGTYILAWLEGVELNMEVKDKMKETLLPYMTSVTENNIERVFNSFVSQRLISLKQASEKLKEEQKI